MVSATRRWLLLAFCWALLSHTATALHAGEKEDYFVACDKADALVKKADYPAASREYERALALAPRVFGPNTKSTAYVLNELARVYQAMGQNARAEPLFQRSLKIYEAKLGPDHYGVAMSLNNLAVLYRDMAQNAQAEPLFLRSLKIREAKLGPDHPEVAASLNNLAVLYQDMGQFEKAEQFYQRSLKIWEAKLGPDHPDVASSLNNLATLYDDMAQYAKAEPLFQRSLKIREAMLGSDHPDVAMCLNNLASLYYAMGQKAKAEPLFQRSLKIYEAKLGPDHPDVAMCLNNLAVLYQDMAQFEKAEQFYQRSLKIKEAVLGPDHPDVATSLHNLAHLYQAMAQFEKAESLYQRSLKITEAKLGSDHPDVARSLHNLALQYKETGEFAKAESLYQRSLKIQEAKLGTNHTDVASSLYNLADLYYSQNRNAEAGPLVDRALALGDRAHADPTSRFRSHRLRAQISWRQQRKAAALDALNRALDLAEAARGQSAGAEQERSQFFGKFAGAFEQMVAWQVELKDTSTAYQASERARARSLVDQLQLGQVDLLAGLPAIEADDLRRRDAEANTNAASLEKQSELLERQPGLSADERDSRRDQLQAELGRARETLVEVYRDIRNVSPAYRLSVGRDFKPAGLTDIQSHLRHDDALVLQYFFGAEAGYLFAIPSEGEPRLEELTVTAEQVQTLGVEPGPLTAERLQQILSVDGREVPKLLSDPNTAPVALARLAALWKLLIPEAERNALTNGEVKELVVIPDGALALLPFETLIVEPGDSPKYLLDVGPPIFYAPSATVLLNLATRSVESPTTKSAVQPVLTIANPVYGGPQRTPAAPASALDGLAARSRYGAVGGELAPLPHTGTESAWVTDVYKKQGIASAGLLAGLATEANVRFNAPGRRVLHFACHGLTDQAYGNFFGALALTPGKQGMANPADDGFLTLPEIYELDLKSCELAILSACETNYGPQQQGEGVWALSRGFLVAGARRVVASNWLVDDEAAASLISYFCGGIAKAEAKGEPADHAKALHDAKRWVRQQEKWSSPYYWGTFVLVGPN